MQNNDIPKNVALKINTSVENVLPEEREELWQWLYNQLAQFDQQGSLVFMNYGYEYDDKNHNPKLEIKDQPYRFMIQLYHHLIQNLDLSHKDILEVGCGRGGGGFFIDRYYPINSYTGMDISNQAIKWCKNNHISNTSKWVVGSANSIPIEDNSKDIIINIESSHCYPSMPIFLSEVKRILKQGGYFCIADFRNKETLEHLHNDISHSGLIIKEYSNITSNVLNSLEKLSLAREMQINNNIPIESQQAFRDFMAVKDSNTFNLFKSNDMIYVSYILQKSI